MSSAAGGPSGTWGWGGVDPAGAPTEERLASGSPSPCREKEGVRKMLCTMQINKSVSVCLVCILSPLPVSPLLPPSVAGEDDDGEEDCGGECGQDDDDDRHGVSRRRYCGGGREARRLTGARCLWLHH